MELKTLPLWLALLCLALPAQNAHADSSRSENEKAGLIAGGATTVATSGIAAHQNLKAKLAREQAHGLLHVKADGLADEANALESGLHPIPSLGYDGEKVLIEAKNHDRSYLRGKTQAPLQPAEIREALDELEKNTPKGKVISLSYTPADQAFSGPFKPLKWKALSPVKMTGPVEEILPRIRQSLQVSSGLILRIEKHPTNEDRIFAAIHASKSAEYQSLMNRSAAATLEAQEKLALAKRLGRSALGAGVVSALSGLATLSAGAYLGLRELGLNAAVVENSIKNLATEQTLMGDAPPASSAGGKLK